MVDGPVRLWSETEVAATVASYLAMLELELSGDRYNKARENAKLRLQLDRRSKAAVEFKHQNISAVMMELGWIPIAGYKPASNYQSILADEVAHQLSGESAVAVATERALTRRQALEVGEAGARLDLVVAPQVALSRPSWVPRETGVYRDYVLRDGQNRALGLAGETAVVKFERARLTVLGQAALASKVEHVAQTRGDGLGYDVLSFEIDGSPRHIEVKTTRYRKELPFFVSQNEVAASVHYGDRFQLYRLFQFEKKPGLFTLRGSLEKSCEIQATQYVAVSRGNLGHRTGAPRAVPVRT